MIFMLRGATCSGKDTFIEQHFTDDAVVFSSDQFRKMLCGNVHAQQFNKLVFDTMYQILDFRLSQRVEYTVYNATNLKIKDASRMIELSKKYRVPLTIISIIPPSKAELHSRNNKRHKEQGFLIPDHVIDKHHDNYYNCMNSFLDEAKNNSLVKFIEIDQDYEVVREI